MENTLMSLEMISWLFLITGFILMLSDILIPSGGLLSGTGFSLVILSGLNEWGIPWWGQIICFFPLTIGSAFGFYKLAAKSGTFLETWLVPDRAKTGVDALPGSEGKMLDTTHALVRGDRWEIRCTSSLETGDLIQVVELEGACLRVELLSSKSNSESLSNSY